MKKHFILLFLIFTIFFNGYSQDFVDGYYINLQQDTVFCKILSYSKRSLRKQDYKEIIVKIDSTTEKTFLPQDIIGYSKDGNIYKSFYSKNYGLNYFGKLIIEGDVNVWEKISTPENISHLYILKKKSDDYYVVMAITGNEINVIEASITVYKITQNELYWTAVLYIYFADCKSIVAKLRSGFYTSADFISIAKEYNNCDKIGGE